MNRGTLRRLPRQVRQAHRETPNSYLRRLLDANHLANVDVAKVAGLYGVTQEPGFFAAQLGQYEHHNHGALHDGCSGCESAAGTRTACARCTHGERAVQHAHADNNICIKHRRWVGPDSTQQPVTDAAIRAERAYRRLHRSGRVTAVRMQKLTAVTERWVLADGRAPTPEAMYPTVVRLASLLANRGVMRAVLDPSRTFATAYDVLRAEMLSALGHAAPVLLDGVWLLLRPSFAAVRNILEVRDPNQEAHEVQVPATFPAVTRPLEPFERYLSNRQTALADRTGDVLSWLDVDVSRVEDVKRSREREFLCRRGHRFMQFATSMRNAVAAGREGCGVCSNHRALPGFNSFLETHPWMVAMWDFYRNTVTPDTVIGGSTSTKYWWKCDAGHSREATPNNISSGRGCSFCSRRQATPGESSLLITHPLIAADLDTERNDVTADDVLAGSGKKLWWKCECGHRWQASVDSQTKAVSDRCGRCRARIPWSDSVASCDANVEAEWDGERNNVAPTDVRRTSQKRYWWCCGLGHRYQAAPKSRARGRRCVVCDGTELRPGINDLKSTYPELAPSFARDGGKDASEVDARPSRSHLWVCDFAHRYEATVRERLNGRGCPYCSGRRVLTGFNDVATRDPELAPEWHSRNGVEASQVVPGNDKRWWVCANGHELESTVPNRRKSKGCPRCPAHERAAYDGESPARV